jgi:hypothetical protein
LQPDRPSARAAAASTGKRERFVFMMGENANGSLSANGTLGFKPGFHPAESLIFQHHSDAGIFINAKPRV